MFHIYLGANPFFPPNNDGEWNEWEYIISGLVNENIWVTLDYDLKYQEVLEEGWNEKDIILSR